MVLIADVIRRSARAVCCAVFRKTLAQSAKKASWRGHIAPLNGGASSLANLSHSLHIFWWHGFNRRYRKKRIKIIVRCCCEIKRCNTPPHMRKSISMIIIGMLKIAVYQRRA